jgi:hypothetical protein
MNAGGYQLTFSRVSLGMGSGHIEEIACNK